MSLFLGVAAGAAIAAPSPSSGASDIVPVIPDPLSGKEEQVTKLPNGLSVLILKDTRFPLVSTRLYVHAGSSYETPDQAGISHVLEHMVFKGTDSRPKSAISQEVESGGGYLNAATTLKKKYRMWHTHTTARQILPTGTFFMQINPIAITTVTVPTILHFVPIVMALFWTKLSRCFLYKFVPMNQSCSFWELFAKQNRVAM